MTDQNGNTAWSAQYKAWGEAQEQRSKFAQQIGLTNPIRFQGQYHDHETGLHYNRHRYYDPKVGRFISKDPIGYSGGLNLYHYVPNPTGWIDPLGLAKIGGRTGVRPDRHNKKSKNVRVLLTSLGLTVQRRTCHTVSGMPTASADLAITLTDQSMTKARER
ncbi:RHS repeat-associated core domain-containing protein [Pseudomonas sp. 15A4]|uniref:RHS repeat-associated core domain-containing protein n=1 Tax=Pseudomonas sp. 15A4 TaxID=2804761 RepID=UPI0031F68249